ncbi:FKBP-type peptidyl-prolyl cis-trans isomerase [Tepidimonas charontis]|uniref:Peptidyl-prolyl cis-trans isomerase n=1 Tax=Tepidimonas charontis TaxID=2267262 RepID=A0A554XGD5_9BURK|nr:FKBP-type peptidyl-prolyl cis-trans isomerase [Tepidimonas charontis]TSE34884.1 FKBP-type 16 kDa peptidyl-prolyl cis-trans isomerase [Tepidimonas charontis]
MTWSCHGRRTMPVVEPGSFLTLHYRLSAADGTPFIDTFEAQPATLSLGTGELSPALEQRLLGLAEGARAAFDLPAGEAFGPRRSELLQWVARPLLEELGAPPEGYPVGEVVQFPTPDGRGAYAGTVREVRADGAVLFDFNHPLAGQAVRFEVHIIGVL